MTKAEKKKANSILLLVTFIIGLVITSMCLLGQAYVDAQNIESQKGVFNLSAGTPDTHEQIYLQGEWEFYYNTLLVSSPLAKLPEPDYLKVPGTWNDNVFSNEKCTSGGIASYRCYLKNVNAEQPITVYVPNLAEAYRVYINGYLVSSSGSFPSGSTEPWSSAEVVQYPMQLQSGRTYELVIEVASERFSGLYLAPLLTNYAADKTYTNAMLGLRYIMIGIVLFCAVLFFIIQVASKPHIYTMWLPFLSLLLFFRMLISTEGYSLSQYLFFFLSYERMNLFIFASTFIIKLAALMYFKHALKFAVNDNILVAFSAVFLMVAVGVGLFPEYAYDPYYFATLQAISFVMDLFIFNKLSVSIAKKIANAEIYLLSYMVISIGIMVDAFYTNGFIPFRSSSFMPVCFFIFVLTVAVVHAKEITALYNEAIQKRHLEAELEKANMSVMISQIQPHFLYNALNTIKSLIRRDPKTAENAVIDFSYYLRGNMDSLSKTDPVPFTLELDHIKHYCGIELLRFGDKIDIEYDIGPDAFFVPTLGIQPLVENAIKHGVTKKAEGGTVRITTSEDDKNYYVIVQDNGVGFDTTVKKADDGKSHVGIDITRKRLQSSVNATLDVQSKIDVGTTITVTFPKQDNIKHTLTKEEESYEYYRR